MLEPHPARRRPPLIPYPQIDPNIVSIGPIHLRWYGMMYVLGFAIGYFVLQRRVREVGLDLSTETLSDFAFYLFIGVLLGGRFGYVLFYDVGRFLAQPWEVFALWHGGMSFHGGLLGTIIAGWLYCRRHGIPFLRMADAVAPAVPIGLGLGRLGNFINGELWGRPTDVPWAMVFPGDPTGLARHPSQLYQFALEGVVLFGILWCMRGLMRGTGSLFWLFVAGYGVFRFIGEQFREPDAHLSYILPHVTMGMILSLPMILLGLGMIAVTTWRSLERSVEPARTT